MANAQELQEQGVKLFHQHDYEAAAKLFHQAQDAYAEAGQNDMVAEMKVNIGLVHRALGESQQALEIMQQALRTFQESDDTMRTAQVLGNLGGVYNALGDKEQSFASYRQAADIFKEIGENKLYGETLLAIGDLQLRDGKFLMGATTYRIGLENIPNLTPTQKIIKSLSGVIDRLMGGGAGGTV